MESRVFWFILTCILYRDAIGESIFVRDFASINNTSQIGGKKEDMQSERLIHTQTKKRLVETVRKNHTFDSVILHESPRVTDLLVKTKIENARCFRYCIEQMETDEDKTLEDINLYWSLAGNENETDIFLLKKSPRLKISKYIINSLASLENNCQIYLYLGCEVVNMEGSLMNQYERTDSSSEINDQSTETSWRIDSEFPKETLMHRINLSGYTESKFYIDVNVTKIIINIRGNLTRAILAIPTTDRTMQRPAITISLARMYDAKGVTIGARNPPPGGWLVKLTGVENSKYNLGVTSYFGASEENYTKNEIISVRLMNESEENLDSQNEATTVTVKKLHQSDKVKKISEDMIEANDRIDSAFPMKSDTSNRPKFVFERSAEVVNDVAMVGDLSDASLSSSLEVIAVKDIVNSSALSNNSLASYGDARTLQSASNRPILNGRMLILPKEQEQKIQVRSSEVASLNEDIDMNVRPFAGKNVSTGMTKNQGLSTRLAGDNQEDILGKQRILIEVNPESSLVAVPGRIHTVFFDLTNNCVLTVRYAVRATSSSFRISSVRPPLVWLYPGQTGYVAVDIIVPAGVGQNTVNTITLSVEGTEISEKAVYVYVQNPFSKIIDNVRPTIEYSFNSNCAGNLNRDRCDKTFWSADITIRDPDSGLKSVTSTPNRIYPRTEFISGTKNSVTFYYLSTCCTTTATVTAIDILNNQYSRKMDVTEWDNLSQGEIAAIVVGALLLLLLLVFLIISIVYCVRKKNGHDLPYTQRYGSRPPARSERTSF
ncbi:uncharacterized protein LOC105192540 isoform X2 [Harpegnathos saltator]|uniref:uncharacterized protein LOC105192540 isoform X2 n=1 Tax=Harpegnathos saltator TaxID=610380 RepID=UPI000DBED553|nr:uncharacterized protein LOC105192540 isoform X2 [Harpegnathos saltator]